MRHPAFCLAPALILAACSGGASDKADAQADTLENAAEQSTPAAAAVLENQADAIRENGAAGAPGQPGSSVQQTMNQAGAAQTGDDARQAPVPGPMPAKQAVPHSAEQGNPSPKTESR